MPRRLDGLRAARTNKGIRSGHNERTGDMKKARQRQQRLNKERKNQGSTSDEPNDSWERFLASPKGIVTIIAASFFLSVVTSGSFQSLAVRQARAAASWAFATSSPLTAGKKSNVIDVTSPTPNQVDFNSVRFKSFAKGLELASAERYKEAIPKYEACLAETVPQEGYSLAPTDDVVHVEWANALRALGEVDDAVSHYKSALNANERTFSAMGALAHIHAAKANAPGTTDEARDKHVQATLAHLASLFEIRQACEPHRQVGKLTPNAKGNVPSYCKEIKETNKEVFGETIREGYMLRAELYFNGNEFPMAEAYLKMASKIRGHTVDTHEKLGMVYEKLGNYKVAARHYKKCKSMAKESASVCKERLAFLKKVGKEAAEQLRDTKGAAKMVT